MEIFLNTGGIEIKGITEIIARKNKTIVRRLVILEARVSWDSFLKILAIKIAMDKAKKLVETTAKNIKGSPVISNLNIIVAEIKTIIFTTT